MKRADPHTHPAKKPLNASPHFSGSLIGKSQGQNLIRLNPPLEQSHNAMCNDASFSRPGPCQDKERSFKMFNGLMLSIRQTGSDCRGVYRQDGTPRSCGRPSSNGQKVEFPYDRWAFYAGCSRFSIAWMRQLRTD